MASPSSLTAARRPPLALIAGPTASGKSALAVALAKKLADAGATAAVVNADASQVYADLCILSARPMDDEMDGVPHRLFGHVDGAEAYNAARWAIEARGVIAEAHAAGRIPILVGGTGLYLRTLLFGIAPVPEIDPEIRAAARALSFVEAHAALAVADPAAAVRLNPADTTRVARALEVVRSTGRTLANWQQAREGGIADRPANEDEGGKTNKGVSQILLDDLHKYKAKEYGTYPTDTGALTDAQIDTILRKEIFDPLHIWQIAEIPNLIVAVPEMPAQLFDIGVLQGIGYAGQVLQETLDEIMGTDLRTKKAGKLEYDGVIGPATRKVIGQALLAGKLQELNNLIVDKRIVALRGKRTVASNPGWFPRAESFRVAPSPSAGKPTSP